MKLKILYLILFMLLFIPIGLCEKFEDIKELNNIKIYDENNKMVSIYDKNNEKSMNIKLISITSNIDKLIKIVEITNYIEYIPNKENDFITKTKKIYGKNDVYKIEYFIEKYNYTFENIIINETIYNNKTGKNEIKLINKSIIKDIKIFWIEFNPYNKIMFENETFKLKIIHYKKPELGFFKIQTIPIFKNIECKEFTWWLGNWNLKRPILINNTYGDNITNYQLKSVNLSQYQINASSTRIINESSGLIQNHWNETIDKNGNLEYVWCNFSKINNGSWNNNTYYIYYQSFPISDSISNGNKTFIFFDDFNRLDSESVGNGWTDINNWEIKNNKLYLASLVGSHTISRAFIHENYIFEIKFCSNSILGKSFGFKGYGDVVNRRWQVEVSNDGKMYGLVLNDAWVEIGNYDANIWYDLKLNYIKSSGKIDYIVKDVGTLLDKNPYSTALINEIIITTGTTSGSIFQIDNYKIRKYTINEPELWTVGNIEYSEGLNMTCNLKIITHLTNKKIQIVDMNASIVNESYTNECINLTYDSYIVYMSNPVKIDSMTGLLNILDNILVQFLLFVFLIIIATLFYVFIQVVKKKGFKL